MQGCFAVADDETFSGDGCAVKRDCIPMSVNVCILLILLVIINLRLFLRLYHMSKRADSPPRKNLDSSPRPRRIVYPNKTFEIDLTNMRKMSDDDLIDYYIMNYGTQEVEDHIAAIQDWKDIEISLLEGDPHKIAEFEAKCLEDQCKAFHFIGCRSQTRYTQRDYTRQAYQVWVDDNDLWVDQETIMDRIYFLQEHNYAITYDQYTRVDQRRALTNYMKGKIKERDQYTCQLCGRYMPDGFGLEIDHIVPVSRGGKSIPSNLQVLCSACNRRKGAR